MELRDLKSSPRPHSWLCVTLGKILKLQFLLFNCYYLHFIYSLCVCGLGAHMHVRYLLSVGSRNQTQVSPGGFTFTH